MSDGSKQEIQLRIKKIGKYSSILLFYLRLPKGKGILNI